MTGRISMGGSKFRVRVANAYGAHPVTITAAHLALRTEGSAIDPRTDRKISFGGKPSVTMAPGAQLISDPIELTAPNFSHFAVSLYIEHDSGAPTTTFQALHPVSYVASSPGDFTTAADLPAPTPTPGYYWLNGIDVFASPDTATVVALGDSITDESGCPYEDNDWPSVLADRLAKDKRTRNLAVVNVGISGNRVLGDGMGVSGLARFERDVLAQPGVRWVILLEGINDIGFGTALTPDEIIDGYQQIISKAHSHGIGIIGCALLPFKGSPAFTEAREKIRTDVNQWIRTSGAFDVVVELPSAIQDPADPQQVKETLHRGDHIHPNADGYRALGSFFDLSIFQARSASKN